MGRMGYNATYVCTVHMHTIHKMIMQCKTINMHTFIDHFRGFRKKYLAIKLNGGSHAPQIWLLLLWQTLMPHRYGCYAIFAPVVREHVLQLLTVTLLNSG